MTATYDPDTPLTQQERSVVERFGLDKPEPTVWELGEVMARAASAIRAFLAAWGGKQS